MLVTVGAPDGAGSPVLDAADPPADCLPGMTDSVVQRRGLTRDLAATFVVFAATEQWPAPGSRAFLR